MTTSISSEANTSNNGQKIELGIEKMFSFHNKGKQIKDMQKLQENHDTLKNLHVHHLKHQDNKIKDKKIR